VDRGDAARRAARARRRLRAARATCGRAPRYRLQAAQNLLRRLWLETRPAAPLGPAADERVDARATAARRHEARTRSRAGVGISRPHESAHLHVAGAAPYVDDLPELAGTLHAALGLSPVAHGRLVAIDRERIAAMPGVVAVLVAADIPGRTTAGRSSTTIRSSPTASSTTSASRCSR
jgi:xanthine dehydrogenase large subunit